MANSGLFRTWVTAFGSQEQRDRIDRLALWIRDAFRSDLAERPSRHVYVESLPVAARAEIDGLRADPMLVEAIRGRFDAPVEITPMKQTDELYLCHYNKDLGGDHGLFARHYDGNLRSVPFGAVVRALIYVRSEGNYRVVFADSAVERNCRTYDVVLLDFHRELHWVEGTWEPQSAERFVLKVNFLVVPRGAVWTRRALLVINVGQFYVVKAAMEFSKSPRTPAQRLVGLVCNGTRLLNNVHPLLPHMAFVGAPATVALLLAWIL